MLLFTYIHIKLFLTEINRVFVITWSLTKSYNSVARPDFISLSRRTSSVLNSTLKNRSISGRPRLFFFQSSLTTRLYYRRSSVSVPYMEHDVGPYPSSSSYVCTRKHSITNSLGLDLNRRLILWIRLWVLNSFGEYCMSCRWTSCGSEGWDRYTVFKTETLIVYMCMLYTFRFVYVHFDPQHGDVRCLGRTSSTSDVLGYVSVVDSESQRRHSPRRSYSILVSHRGDSISFYSISWYCSYPIVCLGDRRKEEGLGDV